MLANAEKMGYFHALLYFLNLKLITKFFTGTLYVQMGRLDEGEKNLLHALKLNPHHHGAMNNLRVVEHQRKTKNKQR